MSFWKKKKPEQIVFGMARFRTMINIQYGQADCIAKNLIELEILDHRIESGFLRLLFPNGDERYISLSKIKQFDVYYREIKDKTEE